MVKYKTMKNKLVFYHAIKLNSSTDKMFKIMKEAFGSNFTITGKVDLASFFKTMLNSMTTSIEESKLQSQDQ